MTMRRALLLSLGLLASACTATNIDAPSGALATSSSVIVFSSNREDRNFEIWRVNPDGTGLVRLTHDLDFNDMAPVLSNDGRLIAWQREVASAGGGVSSVEIWVMNADGTDRHAVVQNGAFNESPSFLPNGDLVYSSDAGGNFDIYVTSAAGGGTPRRLTNSPFADQYPRVSPDGKRIAFQSNRDLNFEIYVMDADGSNPRNVTQSGEDDRFPAWSPDGNTLVWSRYIGSFDLWTSRADGTGAHELYASPYNETQPSVSADGTQVVFASNQAPPSSLFVVPITGGAAKLVTGGATSPAGSDLTPYWGAAH